MGSEQDFLMDVDKHQMQVIRDDGVYRHIRFKRLETSCMHFDLVTWPGYLAYTGDMGCYVFSRLSDMFEFFRTDRKYAARNGATLSINLGYWSEKLQAVDGSRSNGSATEFSADKFRRVINEYRLNWVREYRHDITQYERRELWEAVDSYVLSHIDDNEQVAMQHAYDFSFRVGRREFAFTDLFEHNFTEYTHRFIWCCYALAWGIKQYDDAKIEVPA
jgi:hypothetical protein